MGQKVWYNDINERNKPMNNEPNKPVELTEKELADIAGGATVTAEILAKMEELAAKRGSEKMVKTFDSRYVDALKANSAALE